MVLLRLLAALALVFGVPSLAAAQLDLRTQLVDLDGAALVAPGGEREIAMTGLAVARLRGEDRTAIAARLAEGYERMEREAPGIPSPRLAGDDAVLVIEPGATDRAVVLLHGYGGSFALPCWAFARAAARAGWSTLCPSIGDGGDWWTARGADRLRASIDLARDRGARRIAIAGLSNGARGAAELAARSGAERAILISGASRQASPVVPTLIVQGDRDRMSGLALARAYARRAPRRATLAVLAGGHFVLLERLDEIGEIVERFLRE
jgi:pimeloyl-ACP methyl ester carboxylesterase